MKQFDLEAFLKENGTTMKEMETLIAGYSICVTTGSREAVEFLWENRNHKGFIAYISSAAEPTVLNLLKAMDAAGLSLNEEPVGPVQ